MWVKFRHKIVFGILRPFLMLYFKCRYKLKIEKMKGKGPYLILANHCTTMDPFFIGGLVKVPVYYMASEDIFNKGFVSKLIRYLVAPIPKSKSMRDSQAIRDCLQVRDEGGTICIFPEGNRTYGGKLCNIDSAIGKLVKKLNMEVLLVNIIGGFQTDPRFSDFIRKGKMVCKVKKIITKDELDGLTSQEIFEEIKVNLSVPLLQNIRFKSNKKAEYLERVIYYCADCHSYQTMQSQGDQIICLKCGYTLKYNEYAKFELLKGNYNPSQLCDYYDLQEQVIKRMRLAETLKINYRDSEIILFEVIRCKKKNVLYEGEMLLESGVFILKDSQLNYPFDKIVSMTCVGKNKLNFYIDNRIFQIKGNKRFCALKYMQTYYHYIYVNKEYKTDNSNEFLGL